MKSYILATGLSWAVIRRMVARPIINAALQDIEDLKSPHLSLFPEIKSELQSDLIRAYWTIKEILEFPEGG